MPEQKKVEVHMVSIPASAPTQRTQYEWLLDSVLDGIHNIVEVMVAEGLEAPDDSDLHELIQRLRDEFGPGVTS